MTANKNRKKNPKTVSIKSVSSPTEVILFGCFDINGAKVIFQATLLNVVFIGVVLKWKMK